MMQMEHLGIPEDQWKPLNCHMEAKTEIVADGGERQNKSYT